MTIVFKITSQDYKKLETVCMYLLHYNLIYYASFSEKSIVIYKYKNRICKDIIYYSLITAKMKHYIQVCLYIKRVLKISYILFKII